MLYRFLGGRNTSGRLVSHLDACFLFPSLDSLTHDERSFGRCVDGNLTGRSLDKITTGSHGEDRGFPDILCGLEQTGLENHFEVLVSANGFEFADLIEALLIVTLQEFTNREDDVNLRSTRLDSHRGLRHLDLKESLRSREPTADTSDIEFRVFERSANVLRHSGIDTDSSYVRYSGEILLEVIHRICHLLHFGDCVIGTESGVINLMEALFPDLNIIILRKMLCFNFSNLSLDLLIGKRAGILRK